MRRGFEYHDPNLMKNANQEVQIRGTSKMKWKKILV